jgi:prepilin-type N-terminal cleavage/methylation domain-containing protein
LDLKGRKVQKMVRLLTISKIKRTQLNNKGLTLIEILAVISILGILAAIAVPTYLGYIGKVEKEVCYANSLELERMYHGYMDLEGLEHTDALFLQYIQEQSVEVCPSEGIISYIEGKVSCSIHPRGSESKDEDGDDTSVPYL